MSCNLNVPIDDIVKAIVENYGCELVKMCKSDDGDCCKQDVHVNKFYADKQRGHLTVELNNDTKFSISKAELVELLNVKGSPGIKTATLNNSTLVITKDDGSAISVDMSKFDKDTKPVSGSVGGNQLSLKLSDGSTVNIDLTELIESLKPKEKEKEPCKYHIVNVDGTAITLDETLLSAAKGSLPLIRITEATPGSVVEVTMGNLSETYKGVSFVINNLKGENKVKLSTSAFNNRTNPRPTQGDFYYINHFATVVYVGNNEWDIFGGLD